MSLWAWKGHLLEVCSRTCAGGCCRSVTESAEETVDLITKKGYGSATNQMLQRRVLLI